MLATLAFSSNAKEKKQLQTLNISQMINYILDEWKIVYIFVQTIPLNLFHW